MRLTSRFTIQFVLESDLMCSLFMYLFDELTNYVQMNLFRTFALVLDLLK